MPDFRVERQLRKDGYRLVAGLDEAGRGAWAGPLYAAAAILPLTAERAEDIRRMHAAGVRDGKRISPRRREWLYEHVVRQVVLDCGVGHASAAEIDELGLTAATRLAMTRALDGLSVRPDHLLIDGRFLNLPAVDLPQQSLRQGEWQARCIAAASIIAKVERDRHMCRLDEAHPRYGFAQHKGYGTQAHQEALRREGVCAEHRRSFRPVAVLLDGSAL